MKIKKTHFIGTNIPWVPEPFLARFLVSVKSYSDPRGFGLRPKMCQPSANTENSRRTREKPLVPRVVQILRNKRGHKHRQIKHL